MPQSRYETRVMTAAFITLLVALSLAMVAVLRPFIVDLLLALVLTTMYRGPYLFMLRKARLRPAGAAAVALLLMLVSVLLPLGTVVLLAGNELVTYLSGVVAQFQSGGVEQSLKQVEASLQDLARLLGTGGTPLDLSSEVGKLLNILLSWASQTILDLARQSFSSLAAAALDIFIVLFVTFFLLKDGAEIQARLRLFLPLPPKDIFVLLQSAQTVITATIKGTLIIGLIEGAVGMVVLWLVGAPAPLLWGSLLIIASPLPPLSINLVTVPAGLSLILTGHPGPGLVLILVMYAENLLSQMILKPRIQGRGTGLHPALILLSTLGAMAWLGLIGYVIGPVLAAMCLVIWTQFSHRFSRIQRRQRRAQSPAAVPSPPPAAAVSPPPPEPPPGDR